MITKFRAQITMDIQQSLQPSNDSAWEKFCIELENIIEREFEKLEGIECVEAIIEEI